MTNQNRSFITEDPIKRDLEAAQGRYRGVLPQEEIEESRRFLKEHRGRKAQVAVAEPDYGIQRESTPDGEYLVLSIGGLPCIPGISDVKALLPSEIRWTEVLANRGVNVAGTAKISKGVVSYSPINSNEKVINPNKIPIISDAANLERIVNYATLKQF